MEEPAKQCLEIAPQREIADEWALVLASQGLDTSVRHVEGGFALEVPSEQAERAAAALLAYAAENSGRAAEAEVEPPPLEQRISAPHVQVALAIGASLLLFFLITGPRSLRVDWFDCGSAESARILVGDLWRTVTALTLHANTAHVLSNALAGTLFLSAVFASLGPGLGAALVLLAGAGGNLLNALFQSPFHISVGASTSVFGAVGLLAGLGVVRSRRRGRRGRRAWAPVAAGLALVAMLGTGERADIWAHVYGLGVGSVLGLLAGLLLRRPPELRWQIALGAASVATILYCWALALEPGLCSRV